MNLRLTLKAQAVGDIEQTVLWYENQRTGLGIRFFDELELLFERIVESPLQFPEIEEGARRALLQRFPYGIYFTHNEAEVVVLAVLHLHRHPDTWRRSR
jgi:plasmid stabilization system protein ParE